MVSGYLGVTRNLTHRHMTYDNNWPRYGEQDESVNHVIFERRPALQS